MYSDIPPYAEVQQADPETVKRAQEGQKQWGHNELNQRRAERDQLDTQLGAESQQRWSQTGQG